MSKLESYSRGKWANRMTYKNYQTARFINVNQRMRMLFIGEKTSFFKGQFGNKKINNSLWAGLVKI